MKRFKNKISNAFRQDAVWPDSPKQVNEIFEPRKAYRKLRVVVDNELIDGDENKGKLTKKALLKSLLECDLIEFYKYADEGPAKDADQVKSEEHSWAMEPAGYVNWVKVYPPEGVESFRRVTYSNRKDALTHSAIGSGFVGLAGEDLKSHAYAAYTEEERTKKRIADMVALEAAQKAVGCDIFISEREYFNDELIVKRATDTIICKMDEAIQLVSLYLRAQEEYILPSEHNFVKHSFNRGLFYWVGTRELLHEGWRWFSACVYHSSGTGNDKLANLGGAVLSRSQQALEARDRVHIALNRKTNNDVNDYALSNLDQVLLQLMGAVDATARVAHYVLNLSSDEYYAGWQRKQWLDEVRKVNPDVAKKVQKDSRYWHVLTILRLLRNSIHGEAVKAATLQAEGETDTVIMLPKADEVQILKSMDAIDGREAWGFRPFAKGHDNIMPGIFVDKLVVETIDFLNVIMKVTPVETLTHIEKANIDNLPPVGKNADIFSEWNRKAIKWQLGL